ncbi:MAG: hypothetical protein LBE12_02160 [Planctomycetaceae bacterium]|jgi:hypothetical protein|nr:hypothetical protein [Planctomycetaceae bacterium]
MSDSWNNIERYGDDLNNTARMGEDIFETQSQGINRVWFLPIILLGGLLTTSIIFVANYAVDFYFNLNLLMLLVNHVIPIGVIYCGFLAGLGYAIAERLVQFFPEKRFIFFIFLIQFALFFVARYIEYNVYCYRAGQQIQQKFEQLNLIVTDEDGNIIELDRNEIAAAIRAVKPSFIKFYRALIEESEWVGKRQNDKPFKMGKWGWAIEFISAFVFALCSLAASGVLMWFAYCRKCRRFMSQKLEFTFPMRAPKRKIKKNDEADLELFRQEEMEAINYAIEKITPIEDFLKTEHATNRSEVFGLLCEIRDEIAAEAKPVKGVPNAINVTYSECNTCGNFLLVVSVTLLDVNNKTAFQAAEIMRFTDEKFVTTNEVPTLTI